MCYILITIHDFWLFAFEDDFMADFFFFFFSLQWLPLYLLEC